MGCPRVVVLRVVRRELRVETPRVRPVHFFGMHERAERGVVHQNAPPHVVVQTLRVVPAEQRRIVVALDRSHRRGVESRVRVHPRVSRRVIGRGASIGLKHFMGHVGKRRVDGGIEKLGIGVVRIAVFNVSANRGIVLVGTRVVGWVGGHRRDRGRSGWVLEAGVGGGWRGGRECRDNKSVAAATGILADRVAEREVQTLYSGESR